MSFNAIHENTILGNISESTLIRRIELSKIVCIEMDLDDRKPVFGVSEKVTLKPGCSATENS